MRNQEFVQCSRCVMDTTDPEIVFDKDGVCNHCHDFDERVAEIWFPNETGSVLVNAKIEDIKKAGQGNEYDCIIGLSGGVDSSYLALVLKDYGLRPLVVHIDAGWNSELAVYNIEQIVKYCGFDLYTHVMDWEEIKDLQLAYLKAGIANQDVVQDHAFFATLYHFAVKNKIKYVISGGNIATEYVQVKSWQHAAMDAINLKDIHRRYGKIKLKSYKTISFFQYYFYYPYIYKMKTLRPLNFMEYDKNKALEILKDKVGYKEYGRKHGESVFTKFFQNHYLPEKFNYDKRLVHLSSMVLSRQITREEALISLKEPLYDPAELEHDFEYVAKKLNISTDELQSYISSPPRYYNEFKNWDSKYRKVKKLQKFLSKVLNKNISNYA